MRAQVSDKRPPAWLDPAKRRITPPPETTTPLEQTVRLTTQASLAIETSAESPLISSNVNRTGCQTALC